MLTKIDLTSLDQVTGGAGGYNPQAAAAAQLRDFDRARPGYLAATDRNMSSAFDAAALKQKMYEQYGAR
jgi:hypothetical protein